MLPTRVSHIVEFLDKKVYGDQPDGWVHRVVKAVWMPPEGFNWDKLHSQEKIFEFNHIVGDGRAHSLASGDKMPKFQEHWKDLGGLPAFQERLSNELAKISETPTA